MNKKAEFVKNTMILLLGKFATQFTSLLLVPLFTYYLMTDDFGIVDLYQTYISLFVPVLTLRLDSAIFRFLIDYRNDEPSKKKTISTALYALIISLVFTVSIMLILSFFINIKYKYYVILNIVILMISSVLLQFLRGLGKNKEYSVNSILTGFMNLTINIVLIIKYNYGANSILISSIASNIICIIYVLFKINIIKYFDLKTVDKSLLKNMLKYSVPMIPNSLSWWIVNVSDRSIITIFISAAANGVYAISCKFSNLLNSVWTIFNMSWQESISLHINDKDSERFISNLGNELLLLFSSISLLIIAILPLFYNYIIGSDYLSSYIYIPFILFANIFNVLSGIIGGIYVGLKKTKQIAVTTILSAVINIVVHLGLINFIGIWAAIISTFVSYFVLSICRYIDIRKYFRFELEFRKIFKYLIIYIIASIIYLYNNTYLNTLNLLFIVLIVVNENKDRLSGIINNVLNKV